MKQFSTLALALALALYVLVFVILFFMNGEYDPVELVLPLGITWMLHM